MTRGQIALVTATVIAVAILFFAFDTVPSENKTVEKSRSFGFDDGALQAYVEQSRSDIPGTAASQVRTLDNFIESAPDDSTRISMLIEMSATWFDLDNYIAAGYYAEQVAELDGTARAWSIAGSTYSYLLTSDSGMQEEKEIAMSRAVSCFEKAISLEPGNIDYRINLAICYVEQPPEDNPMKGIQSLLGLNREHPENTAVMYHLARFGMQTGQTEKAIERLKTAIALEPNETRLHCLLAQAYIESGSVELAAEHRTICEEND